MSSFSPSRGSQDTLVTLSGTSLYSVTGVQLISGGTGALANLVSTSTNVITFYPPTIAPSGIRSGNWKIYNRFGNVTTPDYWTVISTPYISGINPTSGFSGTSFRISGSGIRDITGLYFSSTIGTYTGVFTAPIFENSTWLASGIAPWMSGGLNSYFNIKVMSEGGSSTASQLFYVREDGISLSGISNFPTPLQGQNYLRGTPAADGLEWRTPTQVLADISGVNRTGDYMSGDLYITGAALLTTGIKLISTGTSTGHVLFSNRIFSGTYLISEYIIGGITWRALSIRHP